MQRVLKFRRAATHLYKRGWIGRKKAGILWSINHVLFGCEIGIGAKNDPTCVFYHSALGVAIHSDVEMEKRCRTFQHVKIGSSWRGGIPQAPGSQESVTTYCLAQDAC